MAILETPDTRAMFSRIFAACLHGRPASPQKSYLPKEGLSETESGESSSHPSDPNTRPPSRDRTRFGPDPSSQAQAKRLASQTEGTRAKAIPVSRRQDADMPKAERKHFSATKLAGRSKKAKEPKYFNHDSENYGANGSSRSREDNLNDMFNSLRSEEDAPSAGKADSPDDTIGVESIQRYAELLGVNIDNYEFLILCEIVKADFGQISRKEFVDGWKSQVQRNSPLEPSIEAHRKYLRERINMLAHDPALFKKVYRHAFYAGKEPQRKAMEKGVAMAYWEELFSPSLHPWWTSNVNWLEQWQYFLEVNWQRSVNKDMWNQTLEFANRTMVDDTLAFWSEDQAWPGVIDDFVMWCRVNKIVASGMDMD